MHLTLLIMIPALCIYFFAINSLWVITTAILFSDFKLNFAITFSILFFPVFFFAASLPLLFTFFMMEYPSEWIEKEQKDQKETKEEDEEQKGIELDERPYVGNSHGSKEETLIDE